MLLETAKFHLLASHVKGPGVHSYAPSGHGGMKYMCAPEAQCKSHKRYFEKDTTTALYKHVLHFKEVCDFLVGT